MTNLTHQITRERVRSCYMKFEIFDAERNEVKP